MLARLPDKRKLQPTALKNASKRSVRCTPAVAELVPAKLDEAISASRDLANSGQVKARGVWLLLGN